jgi:hypothetical protein
MNARFLNKGIVKSPVGYGELKALMEFYENGGKTTVLKSAKRPKRGFTVGKKSIPLKG